MEERLEKECLDTKIEDLTKAYKTATAAQGDQQSQIVALHSQVRELQAVLSDTESKCTLLQNARRALQAELEGMGTVNVNKISTDPDFQRLQLKNQDLERS
jgi:myosin heavy chain 9/10/11/14